MGHFEFFLKFGILFTLTFSPRIFFKKNLHLFTLINIFVLIYTLGECNYTYIVLHNLKWIYLFLCLHVQG
jgi:hypothetical protein